MACFRRPAHVFFALMHVYIVSRRMFGMPMIEATLRRLAAIVSANLVGYFRLIGADEAGSLDDMFELQD